MHALTAAQRLSALARRRDELLAWSAAGILDLPEWTFTLDLPEWTITGPAA